VELVIRRAAVRSVVAGCECKGLHAGQTPLFDWLVQEGIEQHVESATNEGVPVELLHHIAPHIKDEVQLLRTEEIGWNLVTIYVWVEQWGLEWAVYHGDFLLDDASGIF
jgi:hypothetical protein